MVIDFIHLDVMDGHFVPQLSFGEAYSREISKHSSIPLDVHLMVSNPEHEVPKYLELQPHFLTYHIEATHAPVRLAQSIRDSNVKVGLALSPGTPVHSLEPMLDYIDLVLLMSVEPGYYGQSFLSSSIDRVQAIKKMCINRNILLEVDGGINADNIQKLNTAGADITVVGGACFKTPDANESVRKLKQSCSH